MRLIKLIKLIETANWYVDDSVDLHDFKIFHFIIMLNKKCQILSASSSGVM